MNPIDFVTESELTRLTLEEAHELDGLRFRCWTDLPFGREGEYERLQELEMKANNL